MGKNITKIKAEPNKQEIWIEREFDAPRGLVWKVTTDPEYVVQWWGSMEGHKTEVDNADVRSNGSWRYLHTDPTGTTIGFHGVYHEVLPNERIIETFEWEGLPEKGHVILETTRFQELPNNRTKITIQQVFQSVQDRDGMVASGQEKGMKASHDKLDQLLASMK